MTANIHDRARALVRESHGERTLAEAYRELARRAANVRRYGRVKAPVKRPADFAAVEPRFWWNREDR